MRPDSILLFAHAMEDLPKKGSAPGPWKRVRDDFYPTLIRFLIGLLIAVFCLWMIAGGFSMSVALAHGFGAGWAEAAENAIIDGLILLALLEVIRTFQAYLKLGRVRVTFIIDTALVMLIGELMGLWFRAYTPEKVLLALFVIVVLTFLRIPTGRYSPESSPD